MICRLLLALTALGAFGAEPVRLTQLNGTLETIHAGEHKATVLLFLSTVCPVSNAYHDRIQALVDEYRPKDVRFVLIDSNDTETLEDVREFANATSFHAPLYKDRNNAMADRFDARLTPEARVLDAAGVVQYRGAIDDAQNPARVKVHALRDAIDSVLAKKVPAVQSLKSFGCTIKRVRKNS